MHMPVDQIPRFIFIQKRKKAFKPPVSIVLPVPVALGGRMGGSFLDTVLIVIGSAQGVGVFDDNMHCDKGTNAAGQ